MANFGITILTILATTFLMSDALFFTKPTTTIRPLFICNAQSCTGTNKQCVSNGNGLVCVDKPRTVAPPTPGCTIDGDCTGGMRCGAGGVCVGCLNNGHCTGAQVCRTDTGTCGTCTAHTQCVSTPATAVCKAGTCQACAANIDCTALEGHFLGGTCTAPNCG